MSWRELLSNDVVVYSGLFLNAFGSATLLPLQSEALVVALVVAGRAPGWVLLVASVGNVLGSVVNWLLGRAMDRPGVRRFLRMDGRWMDRARVWYARYGRWSLLLSWVPIIGDPLTVVAGALREPLATFVLLVAMAKTVRYAVLIALTLGAG